MIGKNDVIRIVGILSELKTRCIGKHQAVQCFSDTRLEDQKDVLKPGT